MYTRCPTCSTCFRVTDRHLAIANGKVRCGQCQLIFNAPKHAIDDLPINQLTPPVTPELKEASTPNSNSTVIESPVPAPVKKVAPAPLAPTTKEKLEAKAQALEVKEEVKPFTEPAPAFDANATMIADISSLDKDEVENIKLDTSSPRHGETIEIEYELNAESIQEKLSNNELNHYDEIEDELFNQVNLDHSDTNKSILLEGTDFEKRKSKNIGQHAEEQNIPIQLRNDIEQLQARSQHGLHPLLAVSFIVILLLVSFSQLAFFRAHELVQQIPSSRPLLEAFCERVGCNYSGPRDIKQIQLLSRDVRLHPKEKKALLISAAMINNAYFSQPYPDIHIRLSDISGNIVAERVFNAKTYMGKLINPFLLMKSKTPVHINFEVVDPGKDAINFEFTFL